MRLHTGWVSGAIAAVILNGAAFADVTVSHSNDPTAAMGGTLELVAVFPDREPVVLGDVLSANMLLHRLGEK